MSAVVNIDSKRELPAGDALALPGFEDLPPIMTREELAEIFRTSTRTLDRLHDKGKGPKRRKLRGMDHYRYFRPDVLLYMRESYGEDEL